MKEMAPLASRNEYILARDEQLFSSLCYSFISLSVFVKVYLSFGYLSIYAYASEKCKGSGWGPCSCCERRNVRHVLSYFVVVKTCLYQTGVIKRDVSWSHNLHSITPVLRVQFSFLLATKRMALPGIDIHPRASTRLERTCCSLETTPRG